MVSAYAIIKTAEQGGIRMEEMQESMEQERPFSCRRVDAPIPVHGPERWKAIR